jgi:hypothetical protein
LILIKLVLSLIHNLKTKEMNINDASMIFRKHGYYQTMKEAGYEHVKTLGDGLHILKDVASGDLEIFGSNKNHAGWAIIYKNTHLEFCSTIKQSDKHKYGL